MSIETLTNVAPQSTKGHFVKKVKTVCLDAVQEAFFVEGDATLVTENHTTLPLEKDCLIMPQQVFNPFTHLLERSKD